jgi:hypothetical protein
VIPTPFILVKFSFVLYAIAGMAIGALTGWLASLISKCNPKAVWRNAFLGSFGFLAGFFVCMFILWPTNTVVESLKGGGSVATTVNRYQHPVEVTIVMAVLLPLLDELYRFKRAHAPD